MANGDDREDFPPPDPGRPETGESAPALDSGRPAVAAAPGRMIFVLILAGIFIFIVVRSLFFGGEKTEEKPQQHQKEQVAETPKAAPDLSVPQAPLPMPPPPAANATANLPPPPPEPPAPPAPPTPELHVSAAQPNEALVARIKSPMVVSGGGHSIFGGTPTRTPAATNDPNSAFAQSMTATTEFERATATRVGNLNITIAQGKLIQAVLETAINSDLPGPIRAVVSHDTYAEAGRQVLIPKGSRLIGIYNSAIRRGQGRIFVIWTRVIRPDGVDVAVGSPGVDALGRAGLGGDVDNKYFEAFSSAFLTSALDLGVAGVGQGLFGKQNTTQETGNGGTTTTTTGTASAAAVTEAVGNIGDVGKAIVGSTLNLQPTITIDQGTPVNVFVNKDLVFPASVTGRSNFVE